MSIGDGPATGPVQTADYGQSPPPHSTNVIIKYFKGYIVARIYLLYYIFHTGPKKIPFCLAQASWMFRAWYTCQRTNHSHNFKTLPIQGPDSGTASSFRIISFETTLSIDGSELIQVWHVLIASKTRTKDWKIMKKYSFGVMGTRVGLAASPQSQLKGFSCLTKSVWSPVFLTVPWSANRGGYTKLGGSEKLNKWVTQIHIAGVWEWNRDLSLDLSPFKAHVHWLLSGSVCLGRQTQARNRAPELSGLGEHLPSLWPPVSRYYGNSCHKNILMQRQEGATPVLSFCLSATK